LGKSGKALPVLTLMPVCYVLLGQAVMTWGGRSEGNLESRLLPVLITVLFLISLAMLLLIAYHGSLYGQPPGPAKEEPAKSPAIPGQPESKSNPGRRE
jgi:hypothetical protein